MTRSRKLLASRYTLEVCVDSAASIDAAVAGGAHRLELCSNLGEGGTTPEPDLVRYAKRRAPIDLMMMVRPRGGNFDYASAEIELMTEDIRFARRQGLTGVVFGVLTEDKRVDMERMSQLVSLSGDMQVTFHRAFDVTPDPFEALQSLIGLGVDRILTSGQEESAYDGRALIRKLIALAGEQIEIMPGSGINPDNLAEILTATGAISFHGSARGQSKDGPSISGMPDYRTSEEIVRKLLAAAATVNISD